LDHDFRVFRSRLTVSIALDLRKTEYHGSRSMWQRRLLASWQTGSKKEMEEGARENKIFPQKHAPSDLLPPACLHLVKFPPPTKVAPPAGDQALNTELVWDISYSNCCRKL
jgi:hypothetical protein